MRRITTTFAAIFGFALVHAAPADGQTTYERRYLGNIPGLTAPSDSGMVFLPSNPNKLLFKFGGQIRAVDVVRDGSNHVTGFTGTPTVYADAPGTGGAALGFGPGGVLFYGTGTSIGQIKPGSTTVDKTVNLASISGYFLTDAIIYDFATSPTLPTRSQIMVRYSSVASNFYEATLTPDGNGTFDISSPTETLFRGGQLSFDHVPTGFPLLPANAAFTTSGTNAIIGISNLDANDRPVSGGGTIDVFTAGQATFDPLTGDYLITHTSPTNGGYYAYTAVPEPATLALIGLAAAPLALRRRQRHLV